jgi:hypothetical protein
VGFVVDEVALGQVFSEYFDFPCQFSFHRLLHIHHLSSRAGTMGQLVADIPSGLSLTPPQENKKENYKPEDLVILGEDHGLSFRGSEFDSWCDLCIFLLIDCSLHLNDGALEM